MKWHVLQLYIFFFIFWDLKIQKEKDNRISYELTKKYTLYKVSNINILLAIYYVFYLFNLYF